MIHYYGNDKDKIRTTIGKDVWTGANAVILKGVKIGDGAVVGAGSIVTKDIPSYAIVVGNPARILRYRFNAVDIELLLKVKWWDFKREIIQDMVDKEVWNSIDKLKDYIETLNV